MSQFGFWDMSRVCFDIPSHIGKIKVSVSVSPTHRLLFRGVLLLVLMVKYHSLFIRLTS